MTPEGRPPQLPHQPRAPVNDLSPRLRTRVHKLETARQKFDFRSHEIQRMLNDLLYQQQILHDTVRFVQESCQNLESKVAQLGLESVASIALKPVLVEMKDDCDEVAKQLEVCETHGRRFESSKGDFFKMQKRLSRKVVRVWQSFPEAERFPAQQSEMAFESNSVSNTTISEPEEAQEDPTDPLISALEGAISDWNIFNERLEDLTTNRDEIQNSLKHQRDQGQEEQQSLRNELNVVKELIHKEAANLLNAEKRASRCHEICLSAGVLPPKSQDHDGIEALLRDSAIVAYGRERATSVEEHLGSEVMSGSQKNALASAAGHTPAPTMILHGEGLTRPEARMLELATMTNEDKQPIREWLAAQEENRNGFQHDSRFQVDLLCRHDVPRGLRAFGVFLERPIAHGQLFQNVKDRRLRAMSY